MKEPITLDNLPRGAFHGPGGILEEKPTILKRGKITYYLYNEKVLVSVGGHQWVSYNQYDNWNRQGITLYRQTLLKSKPDEYANASDQMSLAVQCGIRGTSARAPQL